MADLAGCAMNIVIAALLAIDLLTIGFVAGGQLFVLRAVIPYKRSLTTDRAAHLHAGMLTNLPDVYLQPMGIAGTLTTAALLIACLVTRAWLPALFFAIALAGMITVAITAYRLNFPINSAVMAAGAQAGERYEDLGRRWDSAHTVRAAGGIAAFVGSALGAAGLVLIR